MPQPKPSWVKKQKLARGFRIIHVKRLDDIKDFKFDTGCYILIKTYNKSKEIGVAICSYKHEILVEFRGKRPRDVYTAIFNYIEKRKTKWFNRLDHAAYLGKELKKAEMCLVNGEKYVQE